MLETVRIPPSSNRMYSTYPTTHYELIRRQTRARTDQVARRAMRANCRAL